ncbi:hypothetical protein KHS38_19520 [Mucilaginibacter sp. Bleaf8]|uniref:hypothetical protein n=1 Tax=Mucilaginibacter sp. Bleaf8 TaxID=2834430 RepID=UPI001BCD8317|nr:hypothetical protein [Mucilaginibacter sp. Bleaf8]MBS7566604.1 hypothetical protein [Mucilaginibacter sp. Bleaf8]
MRISLLVLFCTVSLSASAQWYKLKLSNYRRQPQLVTSQGPAFKLLPAKMQLTSVKRVSIAQTWYGLLLNEHVTMKTAQHQMRFREYAEASYSFRDLAKIYLQLNKLSQAKWFFLQSNNLSRQQNNDRLTIANLIDLAAIKTTIGDFSLAQQDLDEAHTLAIARNWQDDVAHVNREIKSLQRDKLAALKPGTTYAGTAQTAL